MSLSSDWIRRCLSCVVVVVVAVVLLWTRVLPFTNVSNAHLINKQNKNKAKTKTKIKTKNKNKNNKPNERCSLPPSLSLFLSLSPS